MMILITYDVNLSSAQGARRLRRIAKACQDYGQRVQNSVFECVISEENFITLKHRISSIMDHENDSVRFYHFGKNWQNKVEQLGKKTSYDPTEELII